MGMAADVLLRPMRRVAVGVVITSVGLAVALVSAAPTGAVTDVARTMNVNSARLKVATTTAGQRVLATFQGIAGEVVTVSTVSGTFATNCSANLTLQDPTSAVVAGPVCAGVAGSLTSVTLATHGPYVAVLTPVGTAVGSVKLGIAARGSLSITPLASPAEKVTIPADGTVDLGFDATAGNWLTALATNGTYASACDLQLSFVKPNDVDLQGSFCVGSGADYWEPVAPRTALPSTGTYKARLTSTVATKGSVLLQIWAFADTAGTIALGHAKTVKIAYPGQRAHYTFSGTSGERVTTTLTNASFPPYGHYYVTYYDPAGNVFFQIGENTGNAFIDPITLNSAGSWTVEIDGYLEATGSVQLLSSKVTDTVGTTSVPGQAMATITQPGARARFTFVGSFGHQITVMTSAASFGPNGFYSVNLYDPTGALFYSRSCDDTARTFTMSALNATGQWTLEVDPYLQDTGSVTLQLS